MKRFFALALAGLLLLACSACIGGNEDNQTPPDTTPAPTTAEPGPFASARRIVTKADLRYDRESKPIIDPGEVLVRFHYMDTFDTEAWQASTIIQVAWAIETINHAIYVDGLGMALYESEVNDGSYLFGHAEDYGFGVALSETWMLPEDEFTAAYNALMAEAKGAGAKDFWLLPNNTSGILNPTYDTDTSFRIDSYLPEQLRPNAEPIHMSTELMREYFPFLGKDDLFSSSIQPTGTQAQPKQSAAPTSTQVSPKRSTAHPGSVIAWPPPSAEGSTQLELPEFPGVVFSNEYNKVPNEHGGFTWDCYVKATSRSGEKKLFDFKLGPNSVFIADVTGDGSPDFAYMTSWTSGLFTLGVNVYDYVNDAHYSLAGYGDANGLALENGKLMVARYNADGDLAPIGELVMVDGALVIAGVEKQVGE